MDYKDYRDFYYIFCLDNDIPFRVADQYLIKYIKGPVCKEKIKKVEIKDISTKELIQKNKLINELKIKNNYLSRELERINKNYLILNTQLLDCQKNLDMIPSAPPSYESIKK